MRAGNSSSFLHVQHDLPTVFSCEYWQCEKSFWLSDPAICHSNDEATIIFCFCWRGSWSCACYTVKDVTLSLNDSEWKSYCRCASDSLLPPLKVWMWRLTLLIQPRVWMRICVIRRWLIPVPLMFCGESSIISKKFVFLRLEATSAFASYNNSICCLNMVKRCLVSLGVLSSEALLTNKPITFVLFVTNFQVLWFFLCLKYQWKAHAVSVVRCWICTAVR